ncbi:hypothetical protein QR680_001476 [Steinernema hermaphroditum]|uniref:Peptidase metallopeptidase domain-containing protein n=1 Tax=Steinernema hermaphroditum TaxID=289476 RepID=A0AA39GYF6_9BILA|nr:hypothetical protein QR680_001476 [Steinernema hermaphroditum]
MLRALDQINRDLDRKNAFFTTDDKAVTYLAAFGYLNGTTAPLTKEDIQYSLLKFQSFMGIPKTGNVDDAVRAKMLEKRCGRADEISFKAWEKALPINFLEISRERNANIVISFEERKPKESHDITGISAAETHGARILLWNDQQWSYRNKNSTLGVTNLYHTLLHEIGHVLGMEHSQNPDSIMYPTFTSEKKDIDQEDVDNVRKLYGVLHGTAQNVPGSTEKERKCPKKLDAVTQAANQQTFVFRNRNYWRFKNRKVIQGPLPISQAFPNGPSFVNASVTSGDLTVLIEERTIYGYIIDKDSGTFRRADKFPKMLHDRVLFFPKAAFPLSNGSVILLSDYVFATYDLRNNVPTNLNDKRVFYPNLPDELRGGIPQDASSDDAFWMFTEDSVYQYDNVDQQVKSKTPLSLYFSYVSMPAKLREYVHVPPKRRPALDAPIQDILLAWRMRHPRRRIIRDKTPPPVPGAHPQAVVPADPGTAQTRATPPSSVWIYVPESARNDPRARTPVPRDSGHENIPDNTISLAEECCQRASRMDVSPEGPSLEHHPVSQTRDSVRSGGCVSAGEVTLINCPTFAEQCEASNAQSRKCRKCRKCRMKPQVLPAVVPDGAAVSSRKYELASWIPCRAPSTPADSVKPPMEAQVPPAVVPDESGAISRKYELASWIPCRAPRSG